MRKIPYYPANTYLNNNPAGLNWDVWGLSWQNSFFFSFFFGTIQITIQSTFPPLNQTSWTGRRGNRSRMKPTEPSSEWGRFWLTRSEINKTEIQNWHTAEQKKKERERRKCCVNLSMKDHSLPDRADLLNRWNCDRSAGHLHRQEVDFLSVILVYM